MTDERSVDTAEGESGRRRWPLIRRSHASRKAPWRRRSMIPRPTAKRLSTLPNPAGAAHMAQGCSRAAKRHIADAPATLSWIRLGLTKTGWPLHFIILTPGSVEGVLCSRQLRRSHTCRSRRRMGSSQNLDAAQATASSNGTSARPMTVMRASDGLSLAT